MTDDNRVRLMPVEEVPERGYTAVSVGEHSLLVARLDDGYFAVEDVCPHAGSDLEGGRLKLGRISCPLHGAKFDFRTGASMDGELTRRGLRTFEIHVIDGHVWVNPEPREGASVLFHALSG